MDNGHEDPGLDDDFIDELDELDLPGSDENDLGGEIGNLDDFLGARNEKDDYLPIEPEPLVETWVDGKKISSRLSFKPFLIGLGLICAVALVFALIGEREGKASPRARTPLEAELDQGREIVIETGSLAKITPFLQASSLNQSNFLGLLDEDLPINPADFRIEYRRQTPSLTILLDFSRTLSVNETQRLKEFLCETRDLGQRLHPDEPEARYSLWGWKDGRACLLSEDKPINELAFENLERIDPIRKNGHSVLNLALSHLVARDQENHIVLHLSDRGPAFGEGFSSEQLFSLLKENPRYAIAGLRINETIDQDDWQSDPIGYLAANTRDFKLPAWAFILADITTGTPDSLSRLMTKKSPLESLRVIYRPPAKLVKQAEKNPAVMRSLKLSLNPDPGRIVLGPGQFSPPCYRPVLDGLSPLPQEFDPDSSLDRPLVKDEWIFKLATTTNFQYKAGCVAANQDSLILAALPGGIFLARITNERLDKPDPNLPLLEEVEFLIPHPAFYEEIEPLESRTTNGVRDFYRQGKQIEVSQSLVVLTSELENFSHPGLEKPEIFHLGHANTNENREKNTSLFDALTQPARVRFNQAKLFSASRVNQVKPAGRVLIPGFEILALLEKLELEDSLSNSIVLSSVGGLGSSAWASSPKVSRYLSQQIAKIGRRDIILITPGTDLSETPATNQLLVFGIETDRFRPSSFDPESFLRQLARFAFAPKKLENALHGGSAIASAWAAGMAGLSRSLSPASSPNQVFDLLLRSSELRGELFSRLSFFNHGLLSPRLLTSVVSNLETLTRNLRKPERDSYRAADLVYGEGFLKETGPRTKILPLPSQDDLLEFDSGLWRFDSRKLYHGTGDHRSDLIGEPQAGFEKTDELALVSWRGSVFLFDSRNEKRAWILRYDSLAARGDSFELVPEAGLAFLGSERGEILVIELASGRPLPVRIKTRSGHYLLPAIPTDHGNGQLSFKIDHERKVLWVYGSGSRYLSRFDWQRNGDLLELEYDSKLDAHTIPLTDQAFSPLEDFEVYLGPPSLYQNGQFAVLTTGALPRYLRFDERGFVLK